MDNSSREELAELRKLKERAWAEGAEAMERYRDHLEDKLLGATYPQNPYKLEHGKTDW